MSQAMSPFVSIVVPVLNEEDYIVPCLSSLLAQGAYWADGSEFEIIVIDGGSTDRTREMVANLQMTHPAIRLAHNPKRLQSAAMNLAARIASPRATILLRADGHAVYPPDFLATCVKELINTGVESVVVPMVTKGDGGFQHAVAAAQNGLIGNGGSAHRQASESHFVEHGHHAAFTRNSFLAIGGYNETFSHNEDAEYDHRVSLAGGRIWMCGNVTLSYFPRRDPWGLAKQYFHHGAGRARTLMLHQMRPRLRQMLPLVILFGTSGGLAVSWVDAWFVLFPLAYCLLCLGWGVVEALRQRDPWMLAIGPAAIIMHLSWAAGFVWRCLTSFWARIHRDACHKCITAPPRALGGLKSG
jgi:succinoglycan biosynthesis protein ExoA